MSTRNLITAALALTFCLAGTAVQADDNLLARLAAAESNNTTDMETADVASADDMQLGLADVESLLNDGEDGVDSEEAVAACYRRFRGNYGHRSYGHRSYSYHNHYSSYYSPYSYASYSYAPVVHYKPVVHHYYTPVYTSYWGCW
ncbi:hypothetical protein [Rhodopirellula sp. P2]|uniref:hypothetical protein n=1 Tax=Rhodopirellula sp. P2 TaxID=2127060 RepID=UPI002367E7F8|nr:hypothetical protein [Rhodopirellula sp. P2]WDQ18431.1 hypothetical protein PSR62_07770 [Rhodopirellula sp. P2]